MQPIASPTSCDTPSSQRSPLLLLLRLLYLSGAAISFYLWWVAASNQLPGGCSSSASSGCHGVFASSWSRVFSIPVSSFASAVYVLSFLYSWTNISCKKQSSGIFVQLLLMTCAASAALWFTGLQRFILHSWCYWCMAVHSLGLLSLMVLLIHTRQSTCRRWLPCILGVILFLPMPAVQIFLPSPTHRVEREILGGVRDFDTGPGPNRRLSVLNGKIQLSPHQYPILGSPNAPKLILLMSDYTCPHCRQLHAILQSVLTKYSNELAIISLPVPMDRRCNSTVTTTPSSIDNPCELSRLALAIWKINPSHFPAFNDYLFTGPYAPSPSEAKQKAASLTGSAQTLEAALADPSIEQSLQRYIAMYSVTHMKQVPALILGPTVINGIPADPDAFLLWLDEELKALPSPAPPTP